MVNTKNNSNNVDAGVLVDDSAGNRLKKAREKMGLSVTDVATQLRLFDAVIQGIENDDSDRLDIPVTYIRGYVANYANLVNLPPADILELIKFKSNNEEFELTPPLAAGSRGMERFSEQTARYLAATAIIVISVIWFGQGLDWNSGHLGNNDDPQNLDAVSLHNEGNESASKAIAHEELTPPITASIALLPEISVLQSQPSPETIMVVENTQDAVTLDDAALQDNPLDSLTLFPPKASQLKLILFQDSWVEISSATGDRIEYDLLKAGMERVYRANSFLNVYLGNAGGVHVEVNGEKYAIDDYTTGTTARFQVNN